jgi:DNA-directed RNA polymerase sigma subunit (sigma70/sigma32)
MITAERLERVFRMPAVRSMADAGLVLNVSRERIRQLAERYKLDKPRRKPVL